MNDRILKEQCSTARMGLMGGDYAAERKTSLKIEVQQVENGFAVTFSKSYGLQERQYGSERIFIANNLEAVADVILTEGRKAA